MEEIMRAATGTPKLRVADVEYNCAEIVKMIKQAAEKETDLIVFPELAVTAYTC